MPRRSVHSKWPWPQESVLEIREHVARLYRDGWMKADPEGCLKFDAELVRFGQRWVAPQQKIYEDDDLLTAELVADHEGVQPRTVDLWVSRGLKRTETPDGLRFRFGDVLEFRASRRLRRAVKAGAASGGTADVPSSA